MRARGGRAGLEVAYAGNRVCLRADAKGPCGAIAADGRGGHGGGEPGVRGARPDRRYVADRERSRARGSASRRRGRWRSRPGPRSLRISSLRLMAMSPFIPAAPTRNDRDCDRRAARRSLSSRFSIATTLRASSAAQCVEIDDAVRHARSIARSSLRVRAPKRLPKRRARRASMRRAILPALLPDAFDMLFAAGELPASATVRPLYLRPPDAKPPAPSPLVGAGV